MNPSCNHLPIRPPKRPPKKNARKRLIIQEKVFRELEAAKTRTQDAQDEFHRCATLAASLQAQLVDAAHGLTEMLQTSMVDSSPQTAVADVVDKLCQVQLLHGAVRHSADLLRQACDHVLQSERLVHALEAQASAKSSPSEAHQALQPPPPPPPPAPLPILGSKYGSLDAGAFFSAAADAPISSPHPTDAPASVPHDPKSPPALPTAVTALHSPGRHSACSTPTESDCTRVSQPLQPTLSDAHRAAAAASAAATNSAGQPQPSSGGPDEGGSAQRFLARSSSAQAQWPIATSQSPWLMPSLEPAPSAPANVWQMTPADKRRAERAFTRTRTSGPVVVPEQPSQPHPPGSPAVAPDANDLYERSISAPLRYPGPPGPPVAHAVATNEGSSFGMERMLSASDAHASGPVTPTQPAPHPGATVNAWLQHGSSSEDESEDTKQTTASLMLSMLAPGVPQDLVWSLSGLDRAESNDPLSRAASAHMPPLAPTHAAAIAGSPGRGPGMLSTRSRSDAEAMLAGMQAAGAPHQRMAPYPPGRGGRVRTYPTVLYPPFPHEIAEERAALPQPRMPSEDAVEEARTQVKAVAAALQATYSSLELCALPLIQQLAVDVRSSAPALVGAASLPEASWQQQLGMGRTFDPQRSLSGLSSVQPAYPTSGGQRWSPSVYPQQMPLHTHAPPPPGTPPGHTPHSWGQPGPADMYPPKQSPLHMSHGGTRPWSPLPSEFAQAEVRLGPPLGRAASTSGAYPTERMHSGSGVGGVYDQVGRLSSTGYPSEPITRMPSMPGYGGGRDALPRAPSAGYAAAEAMMRASSSGVPPAEHLQRVLSSGYGSVDPLTRLPSGGIERLPRLRSTPQGGEHLVLQALLAREQLLYPRCELCGVHSNSGASLLAHLESKGHHHKVMAQAGLLCEAVSTRPVEPQSTPSSSNGSGRAVAAKEEGGSTLMHYRPRLHGVRIADEAVSKDVLGLLFQLVQWQMRKADKFREGLPRTMKRCLAGMKEVAWAVNEPGRAKMVLIAPNIQIPCPDSILLEQVLELVAKCRKADVPVIMGPSRKQLGMAFRTSEGSKSTFKLMSAVALLDTSGAEAQWKEVLARYAMLPKAEDVPLLADEAPGVAAAEEPQSVATRVGAVPSIGGSPEAMAALVPSAQALAERIRGCMRTTPEYRVAFQNLLEQASVLLAKVATVASQGPTRRGLGR